MTRYQMYKLAWKVLESIILLLRNPDHWKAEELYYHNDTIRLSKSAIGEVTISLKQN